MRKMKIGAIIQARSSSTRLPKKVLKELPFGSGITVLEQVIKRLKKSKFVNVIIVATTLNPEDKSIISIATKESVNYFRGSTDDVLERYYLAAKENNLDVIVRVTSDCPCIDHGIVDSVIEEHIKNDYDYTSNVLGGFPRGLDVEVFSFGSLKQAFLESKQKSEREHVGPYIYKTKPEEFKIGKIYAQEDIAKNDDVRITLDTIEDYALLCVLFDYLYSKDEFFNVKDVVSLFEIKPWLKLINVNIRQKQHFTDLKDEIDESIRILDLQELPAAKKILEDYINEGLNHN
ncbi:3-deoxy-manno-octulosonate cytidylyltransferase [anaerobic digester metagenome]